MENEICYKIWKFDIEVNGPSHLLISNPSLLNILSSGFISSCDQVLLKITCNESVEVTILTNCQEAEKSLLKRFSEGTILNDLLMINFSFSDISISKLRLVQTGFLLDNGDIDFHSIKSEVDSFLCENSSFLAQSQVCNIFSKKNATISINKKQLLYLYQNINPLCLELFLY